MKNWNQLKSAFDHLPSLRRQSSLRHAVFLTIFALPWFILSPQLRAACQEGCDAITGNTFLGDEALVNNSTGFYNTAIGTDALIFNTTGHDNTATGVFALYANTTGINNTAIGVNTLTNNQGNDNVAVGFNAGVKLVTGSNNIYIGNDGFGSESKTVRIGEKQTHRATFIAGISGATVANGVGVIIDPTGHLGTIVSSGRFKDDVKTMGKASEAIFALQPVTFRYKKELDPAAIPQFGLVAEEVAKVEPDLVARDAAGKPFAVRYDEVNAMLLNEFLKEHRKVEEQEATINQLKSMVAEQRKDFQALSASFKEQASQIQKVSDQLEPSTTAPRVVANNQ